MDKILYSSQKKYLEQFLKNNDSLIDEMEIFAKENKIPILKKDSIWFLEIIINLLKPKFVLELGTAIAYSSIRIARNLNEKSVIYTIEKSKDNLAIAKENIKKSGYDKKINLIFGNALEVLPKLDEKFDLVFLDADKLDYKNLFDLTLPLMKKGGVIFVDNLLWHGFAATSKVPKEQRLSTRIIRQFNVMFTSHPELKSTILPIGDGIGLGIKI